MSCLERRYRLVVTAADVTTGQLVGLPWYYRRVYGLDPDEQPVADAVRTAPSIPFFCRPVPLTAANGLTSTLVDGGLRPRAAAALTPMLEPVATGLPP